MSEEGHASDNVALALPKQVIPIVTAWVTFDSNHTTTLSKDKQTNINKNTNINLHCSAMENL